jgi:Bacterial aa3 type cytochrome c oxidase subunit IV
MAEHGQVEYAVADGNDYAEHERTYARFVTLLKACIAAIVLVLILMAIFLV